MTVRGAPKSKRPTLARRTVSGVSLITGNIDAATWRWPIFVFWIFDLIRAFVRGAYWVDRYARDDRPGEAPGRFVHDQRGNAGHLCATYYDEL